MQALLDDGIPTRKGVMAIHEEGAYCAEPVELPHTEAATREVVMLPLFPGTGSRRPEMRTPGSQPPARIRAK